MGLTQPLHRTLKVVALSEDDDDLGHSVADEKFVDLKFICWSIVVLSGDVSTSVA